MSYIIWNERVGHHWTRKKGLPNIDHGLNLNSLFPLKVLPDTEQILDCWNHEDFFPSSVYYQQLNDSLV